MKVAIVGAGLAGLATAYMLLEASCQVTLFDPKGVGGGASGMASGLMHPYVGEQLLRSHLATEGLAATRSLLTVVEDFVGRSISRSEGIIRIAQTPEQEAALMSHAEVHRDVEPLGNKAFLIRSGVTVHCRSYLNGLFELLSSRGALLQQKAIADIGELKGFEHVVIAAGFGVAKFALCHGLPLRYTRGQVLVAMAPQPLEHSLIGKGYIALGEAPGECHIGSTYEKKGFLEEPCLEVAKEIILSKVVQFFPAASQFTLLGCRAGVRVARRGHYFPLVERLSPNCSVLTALGSRGLLYHALCAEQLRSSLSR